jgi:hypothetical protein
LLAVQAQDPRGARLAVRSRSQGLVASDVDRALTQERSVVVSTLQRGTLHLVRSEDYWWLHPLTTPQLRTASARRLAQEGVSTAAAERGVAVIEAALADGPMGRDAVRERVAAAGVRVEGQALVHILLLATIRGLIVRGPMLGGSHGYVLTRDWLGAPPPPLDRRTALGRLAERYLAGHGPASERDLARWAGITLGESRLGLQQIAAQLVGREDGLADLAGRAGPAELPPPRLLGSFDPVLHGWVSREDIVGRHRGIVTTNGIFRPFAMAGGQAVATWTLTAGRVAISPLQPLDDATTEALDADATAVIAFLRG